MLKAFAPFGHCCVRIAAISVFTISLAQAQTGQPAITLAKSPQSQVRAAASGRAIASGDSDETRAVKENYREFTQAKVSQSSEPEVFTFEFHAETKVEGISAKGDFRISGGTCSEGRAYRAGEACSVEVVFTPLAPGHRSGQVSIAHSASAAPFLTPVGGTAYGPAVQFTPSQIATVPGTFSGTGSAAGGTLLGPQGLAVDGGDSLYIADTGNNLIKFRDSSGAISVIAGGGTSSALDFFGRPLDVKLNSPSGIAVDYLGSVYIADTSDNQVLIRSLYGQLNDRLGGGSLASSCFYSSPCNASASGIHSPYTLAADSAGNIYMSLKVGGLPGFYPAENDLSGGHDYFYEISTLGLDYYSTSPSIAVDAQSDLIFAYTDPGGILTSPTPLCYILAQNRAYGIAIGPGQYWNIAGSGPCGFSGDGGKATGARLSTSIGQFAWDAAGNFYFADTGNNRIRRIDAMDGVIRTVAGNGAKGFAGDGGPSTSANVDTPVGVAVDSTGRVYATAAAANTQPGSGPLKTEVRMFGNVGSLTFGPQPTASHSAAQTVMISNVGNEILQFTHVGFSAGATTDFAIDTNTTNCNFTVPLEAGSSCSIGFIFTPAVAGLRTAVLTLNDDTSNGIDTIQLTGTGIVPAKGSISPASLTFASQKVGTASAAKPITLTNIGSLPLTVGTYTISGTNATNFTQTHTCATILAAGVNCTISVIFKPSAAGARSATFTIGTSAGPITAPLTGTGAAAATKSKVTLTSKANPAPRGQTLVLTSTVAVTAGAKATGTVQLKEGTKALATGTLSNGVVTFKLTNITPGEHVLIAEYLGDKEHLGSISAAVKQVVSMPVHSPHVGRF